MDMKTTELVTFKKKERVLTSYARGLAMVPDHKLAMEDAKKYIAKKKSFGWKIGDNKYCYIDYYHDIVPGYFDSHPEKKEELYRYGPDDLEHVPRAWIITAYIMDGNFETLYKGRDVVLEDE